MKRGQILLADMQKCYIALNPHCFTDWPKIDKALVERLVEMDASSKFL